MSISSNKKDPFVLIDGSKTGAPGSWHYQGLSDVITLPYQERWETAEAFRKAIIECILEAQGALARGQQLAGFLSYEAGYAFEPRLASRYVSAPSSHAAVPLLWFGVYAERTFLTSDAVHEMLEAKCAGEENYQLTPPAPVQPFEAYEQQFNLCKEYILAGDIYQLNLTFPLAFKFSGSP